MARQLILVWLSLLLAPAAYSADSEIVIPKDSFFKTSFLSLREMVGLDRWPRTNVLRAAPCVDVINTQLLSQPDLINRQYQTFGYAQRFTDGTWPGGEGRWDWSHVRKRVDGELHIRICVAPSTQAAYEYLIAHASNSNMPPEGIASFFGDSHRIAGLGTLGFGGASTKWADARFVRDNIAVEIRGHGDLSGEVLPLARKIDAILLQQPARSREELIARVPVVTISPDLKPGRHVAMYPPLTVSRPKGRRVINMRAFVDGQTAAIRGGEICLPTHGPGKTTVEVYAVTDELLGSRESIELQLPGQ